MAHLREQRLSVLPSPTVQDPSRQLVVQVIMHPDINGSHHNWRQKMSPGNMLNFRYNSEREDMNQLIFVSSVCPSCQHQQCKACPGSLPLRSYRALTAVAHSIPRFSRCHHATCWTPPSKNCVLAQQRVGLLFLCQGPRQAHGQR